MSFFNSITIPLITTPLLKNFNFSHHIVWIGKEFKNELQKVRVKKMQIISKMSYYLLFIFICKVLPLINWYKSIPMIFTFIILLFTKFNKKPLPFHYHEQKCWLHSITGKLNIYNSITVPLPELFSNSTTIPW